MDANSQRADRSQWTPEIDDAGAESVEASDPRDRPSRIKTLPPPPPVASVRPEPAAAALQKLETAPPETAPASPSVSPAQAHARTRYELQDDPAFDSLQPLDSPLQLQLRTPRSGLFTAFALGVVTSAIGSFVISSLVSDTAHEAIDATAAGAATGERHAAASPPARPVTTPTAASAQDTGSERALARLELDLDEQSDPPSATPAPEEPAEPAPAAAPQAAAATTPRVTRDEPLAGGPRLAEQHAERMLSRTLPSESPPDPVAPVSEPPVLTVTPEPDVEGLPERPARDEVERAFEAARPALAACAGPTRGEAIADLTITGSGRVSYSRIAGAFAGTREGSCMARALRAAAFPRFAKPIMKIRFAFAL
jgi:hypothetical protein